MLLTGGSLQLPLAVDRILSYSPAPWSFVGVGTVATPVTATPLTLTEPAGVANGDLLVACIA